MSAQLKILIITDSLGFPRSEPEHVSYEQTWVALLKRQCADVDILHHGRGGATLRDLWGHSQYYLGTLQPDLVIFQSGIVDCAPRALTQIEKMIVIRLPRLVGRFFQRVAPSLRAWRKVQYSPPAKFKEYVEQFEAAFENSVWLGIAPSHPEWEASVPGITQAIAEYDAILAMHDHISLMDLTQEDMLSDHHHLSVSGHKRVLDKIMSHPIMSQLLEARRA